MPAPATPCAPIDDGTTVRASLIDPAGARLSLTSGPDHPLDPVRRAGLARGPRRSAGCARRDLPQRRLRARPCATPPARPPSPRAPATRSASGARTTSAPTSAPLYAMGARLYAPRPGPGPAWTPMPARPLTRPSMNRFLYVHANPTSPIDPTGHVVWCDPDRFDNCSMAWLRWGERVADWSEVGAYNEVTLRASLIRIRRLTRAQLFTDAVDQTRIDRRRHRRRGGRRLTYR